MKTPIIVLDVDGVLNPYPFNVYKSSDWKFEPKFISDSISGAFPLNLSKEMGQAIEALNCNVIWLTTWIYHDDWANPNIGKALGWDRKGICHIETETSNYFWKVDKIRKILSKDGPLVVWIDDEANFLLNGISLQEIDPHKRLLIICPEESVGLTRTHIRNIKNFLGIE